MITRCTSRSFTRVALGCVAFWLAGCGPTESVRSSGASSSPSRLEAESGGLRARLTGPDFSSAPQDQPTTPLTAFEAVELLFPTPMARENELDRDASNPPVVLTPAVKFRFRWRSPTQAQLVVEAAPAPNTRYQLRLRAAVADLAGKPVEAPRWGIEWPEAWFTVRRPDSYWRSRDFDDALPAVPRIDLEFSHPTAATEIARTVVWRDERGETIPCDVRLPESTDPQAVTRCEVKPRAPLVPGRRYDLFVEDTHCAIDGGRLAYSHVLPVGATQPLELLGVAGFNQPVAGAFIEARFNQVLEPKSVTPASVRVTPEVKNFRISTEWDLLRLHGDFDATQRYRVEIDRGLRSSGGFVLGAPASWSAHFDAKRAAVVLPRSVITTTAAQGLAVELTQVNTGALRWRVAQVPVESLLAVRKRLNEYRAFDEGRRDPRTNEFKQRPTELLVDTLKLPVLTEGVFDASDGDREVARRIALAPGSLSEGVYLCEISGRAEDGRIAGNRALVFVNREFLVWKSLPDGWLARVFDVRDGTPVADATVMLVGSNGTILARATSDADGELHMPASPKGNALEVVLVRRGPGVAAHFADLAGHSPAWSTFGSRGWERDDADEPRLRQWLFSDRGIYRPGETIRVKGIVRDPANGTLALPGIWTPVAWKLVRLGRDEPVLEGETTLSSTGAWETEIPLPEKVPVGQYVIRALGRDCPIKVDEFRAPAFAVEVQPLERAAGADESRVRVVSRYFHGAPNARAVVRWRARWEQNFPEADEAAALGRSWIVTSDNSAPNRPLQRPAWARAGEDREAVVATLPNLVSEGAAVLAADGTVELSLKQPFPASRALGSARVNWEVSVISADGQTVDGSAGDLVAIAPAQPGVGIETADEAGQVALWATALQPDGKLAPNQRVRVELFRVEEKSVREELSRHVVRFANTAVFHSVAVREVTAPWHAVLPVEGTGRFVAAVTLAGVEHSPRASDSAYVSGPRPAEFAQWDDATFEAVPERPDYVVGETARVSLRAPFAGPAWVTVETDRVLLSEFVRLAGNAVTLEVPVTADMFPNAKVVVYLFRPESLGAPAERNAQCMLRVRRPETELRVDTSLAASRVQPGETVEGSVVVTSLGVAQADAEVTLFAVDESVLRYGGWNLADPSGIFFPPQPHTVETSSGLRQFGPSRVDDPLFQKGFLIGDGGPAGRSFVRRKFAALAFWSGAVRTGADGRAKFSFFAPDNLTAYRIVAVAHRGTDQFGHGEKQVEVARRLQIEPALPRFVRAGDEVELRAVLRQREWPVLAGHARAVVTGGELTGDASADFSLRKALPDVVAFRARIQPQATELKALLQAEANAASAPGVFDGVEVQLPVRPARVLRRESVTGVLPAGAWSPAQALPPAWRESAGTLDCVVSNSPWLPLLDALPRLLDYPHGCNEQVSARVLSFALMADLLDALPDRDARWAEYRQRIEAGLAQLSRAQLSSGDLPYWPGQKDPSAFVTIQAAWAALEAERCGFHVATNLSSGVRRALERIARRQEGVRALPDIRVFALMASASLEPEVRLRGEALELYQQRDTLTDDGRALLALALHRWRILPEEKAQLLAELGTQAANTPFDPAWFGSTTRTEALRLWARAEILGRNWSAAERASAEQAVQALMANSVNFSTQENLWSLVALRALLKRTAAPAEPAPLQIPAGGHGTVRSADGRAAGWYGAALPAGAVAATRVAAPGGGSFVLRATFRRNEPETGEDRGFRVERLVRNLTAAERDGSPEHPFALGDELLVTFRVWTERAQAYVALEESLPAAFETVDPAYLRLTLRAKVDATESGGADLSHFEKRDDRTLWYFDRVPPGGFSYGVVVRVTSAGRFQWPGATVAPMYDARFSGLSAAKTIEVK